MMDFIRAIINNPQNPKNIQIPYAVFMAVERFIGQIDTTTLTDDEKTAHEYVRQELTNKKSRIVNRQTYTAIIQAQTPEEKQTAYENYRATKELYT